MDSLTLVLNVSELDKTCLTPIIAYKTCSLKLNIVQQTLKICDKELVIVEGQLIKAQQENQNMSMRLNKVKQVAKKVESLKLEYNEINQLNQKTHNHLKHLQNGHEQMTHDYDKMERSNMQQEKVIKGLEQTCQDLKKQLVIANIEFEKQIQVLKVEIQDWKGQLEMVKV